MNEAIAEHLASLPVGFLKNIVQGVFDVYKSSYKEISERYQSPEAKDLLPIVRRAQIDERLRIITAGYAQHGNIRASAEKNQARNCSHTEIRAGGLVLTTSAVPARYQLFRNALFRETLAQVNQPSLFEVYTPQLFGTAYYGTILHRPDPREPWYPLFVDLGFPNKECTTWVEHVDLVAYCKLDTADFWLTPADEEVIADKATPGLKPQSRKKEG